MKESDLLSIRANYPQDSGWNFAKPLLFTPRGDPYQQVPMGINTVLQEGLLEILAKELGFDHKSSGPSVTPRSFSWVNVSNNLRSISLYSPVSLYSELLWKLWSFVYESHNEICIDYLKSMGTSTQIVKLFHEHDRFRYLLIDILRLKNPDGCVEIFRDVFIEVVSDPQATALFVMDFILGIRDVNDEQSVTTGFFEGFELGGKVGTDKGGFSITWKAAPMLKALVQTRSRVYVRVYEGVLRSIITRARTASGASWGEWQRQYDREFRVWNNLMQSGMFNPNIEIAYENFTG